MGDGMLSLVVGKDGHLHAVSGITADIADNGPFILFHISPDQRPVTAFCRLVEELVAEIRLGIRSLGYHQQAGGVLVDAVTSPTCGSLHHNRDYPSCARLWR